MKFRIIISDIWHILFHHFDITPKITTSVVVASVKEYEIKHEHLKVIESLDFKLTCSSN